jgi:hypothetical protein
MRPSTASAYLTVRRLLARHSVASSRSFFLGLGDRLPLHVGGIPPLRPLAPPASDLLGRYRLAEKVALRFIASQALQGL